MYEHTNNDYQYENLIDVLSEMISSYLAISPDHSEEKGSKEDE